MVQSAPVSDNLKKRGTRQANINATVEDLKQRLFCAATSIRDAEWLNKLGNEQLAPTNSSHNYTQLVDTMFAQFSNHCKGFTNAMSLKHHVQDLLFNDDTTPELSYEDLSQLLTKLQTMATFLDDLQYKRDNSTCVRLTEAQYRIIYRAKFEQCNAAANDFIQHWARQQKGSDAQLDCK